MKTIRKFFDKDGKEVAPDQAVKCHELTLDGNGKVVGDAWYTVQPEVKQ